ncbi:MAG: hypothetical protein JWL90_4645 [Chthoniobacteraceae bacterium]|nr:hypothetical protein [Chthoniobacteraceae bacterium]
MFDHLSTVSISNFEVIKTTGPNEGSRSAGAPLVNAGLDQVVKFGSSAALQAVVTAGGVTNLQWKMSSGPGAITLIQSKRMLHGR